MKKKMIDLSKIIMIMLMCFLEFAPSTRVVAESITNNNIPVEYIDTENDKVIKIKITDKTLIDATKNYKIYGNISFNFTDGDKVGFDLDVKEVSGQNLLDGVVVINDLQKAMDQPKNSVKFPKYKNGYCEDKVCYNGEFIYEAKLEDSNGTDVGTFSKSLAEFNKETENVVYNSYQVDSGLKKKMTNNEVIIDNNATFTNLKVQGNIEDLNLNKNKTYYVSGKGYDSSVLLSPKDIMKEKNMDFSFSGKIPGEYTITNNYVLSGSESKNYNSSLVVKYGNIDTYLSQGLFIFKNNNLIINSVYTAGNEVKCQDIINHLNTLINENYVVSISDSNGISINNTSSKALTGSKILIKYNGVDKDTFSFAKEYTIITKYDYDANGLTDYADLDKIIKEVSEDNYSINTSLNDESFSGLSYDEIRKIQKNIDNYNSAVLTNDSISINTNNYNVFNGEEVEVSFSVSGINNVNTSFINNLAGKVSYDKNYLELKNVKFSKNVVGSIKDDKFYYAYKSSVGNELLITFVFNTLQATSKNGTNVTINDLVLGAYDNLFNNVTVNNSNVVINKSNDATLSSLDANGLISFEKNKYEYDIVIGTEVESLDLSYITNNKNATVTFDTNTNGDFLVDVTKTLLIRVTAEDGVTIKEYKLNVTKVLSNDSSLSNLEIVSNDIDFDKNTYEYNIRVGSDINHLSLLPILNDKKASYEIIGNSNFKCGLNKVIVKVTAEDGTISEYIVNVYKESNGSKQIVDTSVTNYQNNANTGIVAAADDEEVETDMQAADSKKNTKKSSKKKTKDEETNASQIIIVILIVLVLAGLIYLIFKDDEDDKKDVKTNNKNKKKK